MILIGAFVGWVASIIMGTNAKQGAIANILIGIAGGILGGLIFRVLGFEGTSSLLGSIIVALVGSIAIIGTWKAFSDHV